MPPESGGICGRLTSDVPFGCLQGGSVRAAAERKEPLHVDHTQSLFTLIDEL